MSIYTGTSIIASFTHLERSICNTSPKCLSYHFPNLVLSKSLAVQPIHWPQHIVVHLVISPFRQNVCMCALSKDWSTVKISLHWCPSGHPRKGCTIALLPSSWEDQSSHSWTSYAHVHMCASECLWSWDSSQSDFMASFTLPSFLLYIPVVVWKKMSFKGSGTISRHGLVQLGVVSWEEVYHCGAELWGLIYAQITPCETVHFLLPVSQSVKTLSFFSGTISACMLLASLHEDNRLNLWNCKPPIKCFPL